MSLSYDPELDLDIEYPEPSGRPFVPALTARPLDGLPLRPARGDKVFLSRRSRYRAGTGEEPDLVYQPLADHKRWGTAGLIDGDSLTLGIIVQVARTRPGARLDKADALGAPYGVAVYPAVAELSLRCVFLENEEPAIGDSISFTLEPGGQTFRVANVSESWAEGQFCGADLGLIGATGWVTASIVTEITGFG